MDITKRQELWVTSLKMPQDIYIYNYTHGHHNETGVMGDIFENAAIYTILHMATTMRQELWATSFTVPPYIHMTITHNETEVVGGIFESAAIYTHDHHTQWDRGCGWHL